MKYFVIFLVLIAAGIVATNPVSAMCAYDPTQPNKPCDDSFGILHIQDTSAPFEIKLHQTIKVDGIQIEFSGIEDSRCPSDVICVWEGQAILTFSTLYQTHHESHSFTTGKVTTTNVGPYKITLNEIAPYPTTAKDISEDYVATISISEDSGVHLSPLKQIKSGVSLIDVKCNEGKHVVYKYTRMMAACVTQETENKLIFERGWAVLRLGLPATDNLPRDLCYSYQGKWIAVYKECNLLETPLQCSLLGGVYNECASACRNDPDFPNVICTDNCVEVCSIEPSDIDSKKKSLAFSCGLPFLFVPIVTLCKMKKASLNHEKWKKYLSSYWAPQVYLITSDIERPDSDFHARMFAPALGIPEDPATGSAAAAMSGYLAKLPKYQDGDFSVVIEQGFEIGRPSILEMSFTSSSGKVKKVHVKGKAVVVSQGEIEA